MVSFNNVRAVLFDLDGTLIDSAPDLAAAANTMRAARGLEPLPFERYRPVAGAGARGLLGVAFGLSPDHDHFPAMREEFFASYESCMMERTHAFDGVVELIDTIATKGLLWGVVTNKATRFTAPLTSAIDLFRGAGTIISGDTTPHCKPHPAPLLEAAARLGVTPSQCIYVGDDERDMVAGRAAGMGAIAALYGYLGADTDLSAWPSHGAIKSPGELLNFLGTV
jgi:2-phosphoglycolate phosphatase